MNQPFDSSYSAALLQWDGAISTAEKMPRHNPNRDQSRRSAARAEQRLQATPQSSGVAANPGEAPWLAFEELN